MQLAHTIENERINATIETLKLEFVELFTTHKHMVENEKDILIAIYLEKLGHLQLELLQTKTELARLKMKIKLIQAAFNRSEEPDLLSIEQQLNEALKEYYKQINDSAKSIEAAQKILSSLISEEEAKKLKEIFRILCRRLHPDLNPQQTQNEKDLFVRVKAAYDLNQLAELQQILLFLDRKVVSATINQTANQKEEQIKFLKQNIVSLQEKIEQLKQSFPFSIKNLISDDERIAQQQEDLRHQIQTIQTAIESNQNLLKLMIDE